MYFDAAAFCGNWPFYRLRDAQLPQMLEKLKSEGIGGGFISSLDAIFYNDPWEADGELVKALDGTAFRVAMCVDPMLPWSGMHLQQGKQAGVGAVRLYPCVHDYLEDDQSVVAICRLAGMLELPVILTLRVEDARMAYLLQQKEPDFDRIRSLITQCEGTKFIISNCLMHQVAELQPLPENVWFDTAGFKGDFYLEQQQEIRQDRILFGSFAPLQSLSSAVLAAAEKQASLQKNWMQLVKENV